jgi:hypothetical protein
MPPIIRSFSGSSAATQSIKPRFRQKLLTACGQARAENPLKAVFVNHSSHSFIVPVFPGADYASGAIHLHVSISAKH